MNNRKGFTLAELLIVVAVIGVLVAISIPVFSGQLEKARIAVDQANVRSAKAAAIAEYLVDGETSEKTYVYDASIGNVVLDGTVVSGYGKSNVQNDDGTITGATGTPKDGYVIVTISIDGNVTAAWSEGGTSPIQENTTNISDSASFKFSSTLTWEQISKTSNGVTMPAGTVFYDGEDQYLVYGNNNWYGISSGDTLNSFLSRNNSAIEKITEAIEVLPQSEYLTDRHVEKGTLWIYADKYYVAKENIDLNQWERRVPVNETSYEFDGRWCLVEGQN